MNILNHKFIILGSDHSNTLGQIRSLGEKGIRPIVIITEKNPFIINKSKYLGELHIVDNIHEGPRYVLEHYSNEKYPPFIYTDRDDIMCVIDDYYDELKGKFIFWNAGEKGRIRKLINKEEQIAIAAECGLNVIPTEHVKRGEFPKNLDYPIFTKATNSLNPFWKANAFICHNVQELEEAYMHMGVDEVLLQQYICRKDETGIEGISIDGGRDVKLLVFTSSYRFSKNGFGIYKRLIPFKNEELEDKVARFMKLARYTGIFEIEFITDKNGIQYFLEVNFRFTQFNHACASVGFNMPYLFAKWCLQNKCDTSKLLSTAREKVFIYELEDFKESVLHGNTSFLHWLLDFFRADCYIYIDSRDMRPFLSLMSHKLKKMLKKEK